MNKHTRNTFLYSFLTISLVVCYWIVRQDSGSLEDPSVGLDIANMIEINEQATEGYELDSQPGTVLVSHYSQ